jgi:hypothetical protein
LVISNNVSILLKDSNRGWASGDAADYYQKGIKASMEFYDLKSGLNTFYYLPRGKKLGEYASFQVDVNVDNYLNQASVKYKGNNSDGLNQILIQKYIGFFQKLRMGSIL